MECFVTDIAVKEGSFVVGTGADLAVLAVQALPVDLELSDQLLLLLWIAHVLREFLPVRVVGDISRHQLQTVGVKRLPT